LKVSNEIKVGALTIIAIIILVLGYRFLKGEDLFARTQTVNVRFENVLGLYDSNPVYLNGLSVGKISSIEIDNKVDSLPVGVVLEIDGDIKIPNDSKFEIINVDLLGAKGISFTPGKSSKLYSEDIDFAGSNKPDMIANLTKEIAPIADKASILMTSMDDLVLKLNSSLGTGDKNYLGMSLKSLSTALESVNGLAANANTLIKSETGNIDAVMVNAKKLTDNLNTLTAKLNANTGKIDNILSNFDTLSGKLNVIDLEGTVNEVKKTLSELGGVVDQINNGDGSISKLLKEDGVYTDITKAIKSLDELLIDVKVNPKRYVSLSLIERKDKTQKKKEPEVAPAP
jgi:phospholipid/cholesterol/gamma-HCH transport system substrate-binding protein